MTDKKLLVLGAGGLLGQELFDKDYLPQWTIEGHFGRQQETNANLNNYEQAMSYLDDINPDAIINLVALTDVDYCEKHPDDSYTINVKVVENIVSWIKNQEKKVQLVHISSDQVYDGEGLHQVENVTLKNYYAFSKYAGELAASCIDSAILRTNFFGKSNAPKRSSFTDWLYHSLKNQREIQVFDDVFFSPLSMSCLCEMIALVITKDVTGIYNLGSRSGLSKADFAYKFASALQLNTSSMTRAKIADVDIVKTYRPRNMRLDVSKFEKTLGVTLPCLNQEIIKVTKEYI
ncbi:sugar nucleotide-binding protein [Psychrobacter sp. Arc29]|uniref:SDR family oxidoreductase n=1 Tax=Psychrobacter sp. Arc29 TaxID=3046690 RepID=UPI00352D9757